MELHGASLEVEHTGPYIMEGIEIPGFQTFTVTFGNSADAPRTVSGIVSLHNPEIGPVTYGCCRLHVACAPGERREMKLQVKQTLATWTHFKVVPVNTFAF
eukprot:TRINITY_DN30286_c0_g1_i1.p2 TRINITY_DN30286_c0_g1~~TRINITY_DN30286_c0_g1_i1.p2  ORF type:complete len:101 (-),score=10.32 TRINITY_DN30286_c0_g1_i1:50-352(-)